jgi:CHAD domain-containing protein
VEPTAPAAESAEEETQPPKIALAPDEPVGLAGCNALRTGLQGLNFCTTACITGDIEAIHQLRVTNRRLRAAVEFFAQVLHATRVAVLRRELPWVGRTAGAMRECDVSERLIRNRSARLDPSAREAVATIADALATLRRTEQIKIDTMLGSKRYHALLKRLAAAPVRRFPTDATVGRMAPTMLRPLVSSMMRAGSKLAPHCRPGLLHRLRIRIKRLRYALEMIDELAGNRTRKALRRLTELQDLLGRHNDAVVAIGWLRHFAGTSNASPQTLLAAGALIHSIHRRQIKLATRSLKRWKRFEKDGIIRLALAEVARNARPHPQDQASTVTAA